MIFTDDKVVLVGAREAKNISIANYLAHSNSLSELSSVTVVFLIVKIIQVNIHFLLTESQNLHQPSPSLSKLERGNYIQW